MTYNIYFGNDSEGRALNDFVLNTPEDSSYMTYLSGMTHDGAAIMPSRVKMTWASTSSGRAQLSSVPIFGSTVKYLTCHLD